MCLTRFSVLTLNLRIVQTLSWLTQPSVVQLLQRPPALPHPHPTQSPACLPLILPSPTGLPVGKHSLFASQGLCPHWSPAWNILPPGRRVLISQPACWSLGRSPLSP